MRLLMKILYRCHNKSSLVDGLLGIANAMRLALILQSGVTDAKKIGKS